MASNQRSITGIYGLTAGLALIGYTLLLYRFGVQAFLGMWAHLGTLMVFALAASAAIAQKKMNGGYLEFREALKAAYAVIVIAFAMQTLLTWALMNYIDIPFRQAVEPEVLKRHGDMLKQMGAPADQIEKTIAEERGQNQYTFKAVLRGLFITYILYFLVAVLIAVIVKKKKNNVSPERKQ